MRKAEKILNLLNKYPTLTNRQVADKVGCANSYVFLLRKKMAHVPDCAGEPLGLTEQLEVKETSVDAILTERGSRYGKFTEHARITQNLKRAMEASPNWNYLADDTRETLEMIAHKMGRILNGDPEYADNFIDIAGYAKLVADRLEGVVR